METVRRWRQPIAIVLTVTLAVRVVLTLVAVPFYTDLGAYPSWAVAALAEGTQAADPVLVAATAAAAAWCLRPEATRQARGVLLTAMLVIGAAAVTALTFAAIGLVSSVEGRLVRFGFILTDLVVPAVAVVALAGLLRRAGSSPGQPAQVPAAGEQPSLPAVPVEQQPGWERDQAAGAAWYTAGEAAAGAPASGWGRAEESAGWQPIPTQQGVPEQVPEQNRMAGPPPEDRPEENRPRW